ncbi:GyrI-like domain-containing protein [Thalassomonas actiniarum]|uniref:GyrI-like domain-containing protein n=1 Tax=Thalassomonas actiniarum TaxID=485447 RepID=A0AAF0C210_9GAMM|nr:GyrI-like domain-containing protein [Thalassomonas actiniarum]WDD98002.1 GyrI-like domain-containing protein [Thalassomonas actiniarum]
MQKITGQLNNRFSAGIFTGLFILVLSAQAMAGSTGVLAESTANNILIKSVQPFHFFYTRIETEKHQLADKIKTKAMDMSIKLAKRSNAKIDGPLILSYRSGEQQSKQQIAADIGFPVSKRTKRLPPYKYRKAKAFDCASLTFTGKAAQLEQQWQQLYLFSREQQLSLNGESRMLLLSSEADGNIHVELQLGIIRARAAQEKESHRSTGSITARL